jgi:small subunit ribosomal protein S1
VLESGLEVTVAGDVPGFIRRADLSRERSEQRPDRFAVGDRVDARITNIDRRDHKLTLSVKAHEMAEEKQAMAEYGSSDSGASLGDILGAAMRQREGAAESDGESAEEPAAADDDDEKKGDA